MRIQRFTICRTKWLFILQNEQDGRAWAAGVLTFDRGQAPVPRLLGKF